MVFSNTHELFDTKGWWGLFKCDIKVLSIGISEITACHLRVTTNYRPVHLYGLYSSPGAISRLSQIQWFLRFKARVLLFPNRWCHCDHHTSSSFLFTQDGLILSLNAIFSIPRHIFNNILTYFFLYWLNFCCSLVRMLIPCITGLFFSLIVLVQCCK